MSTERTTKRGQIGALIRGQPASGARGGKGSPERESRNKTDQGGPVRGERAGNHRHGREGVRLAGLESWTDGSMARGGRRASAGANARCGKSDFRVSSTGSVPKSWAPSHVRGDGGCRSVVVVVVVVVGWKKMDAVARGETGLERETGSEWQPRTQVTQFRRKGSSSAGLRCLGPGPPGLFCLWRAPGGPFFFSFLSLPQAQPRPGDQGRARLMRLADEQRQRQRGISGVSVFENNAAKHCKLQYSQKAATWEASRARKTASKDVDSRTFVTGMRTGQLDGSMAKYLGDFKAPTRKNNNSRQPLPCRFERLESDLE